MNLKLYTIDSKYIDYLRQQPNFKNIFDNKESAAFPKKYIGIVLTVNEYNYYVPLSSPKNSDYLISNGEKVIRKSIIPIIRITSKNKNGVLELKGTLKFSNMIPVPVQAISYYDINKEPNRNYKILVEKEYEFIRKNQKLISRHASILYNQKTKEDVLFASSRKKPGYLEHVIDFKYAEKLYDEYISKELFTL